jgi:hypothetical protein
LDHILNKQTMKKPIIILNVLIACFLLTVPQASAQWDGKGTKTLDLGVGLGSIVGVGGGLPIRGSFDLGINENISIGGYAGFVGTSQSIAGFKTSYNYMIAGVRGLYHYPIIDGLDTYGGVLLGYTLVSASLNGTKLTGLGAPANFITYGFVIGARKGFTDNIGAFAELGYGISWIQLGVSIKL